MPTVRILLVDDFGGFIDSAERFLSTIPNIEVVGRALSGPEALAQAAQLRPDLVFMDLAMPGMNGLEATQRLKAQAEAPRVVILTLYNQPAYHRLAKAAGADGFMSKSELGEGVIPLLRQLFAASKCS